MNLIIAFIVGLILMGANTERTIDVYEGKLVGAAVWSLTGSVMLWISTSYIASGDCASYAAFSIGALIVTTALAWKHKK